MKKKILYAIVIVLILLISAYGLLVTWRPLATSGLFKFECCSWAITKYGSIEDKPGTSIPKRKGKN